MDARGFCQGFFPWYNTEHHHSGIGLLTPKDVHLGRAATRIAARAEVLALAYSAHPERFVRGVPHPGAAPTAVWINPPKSPSNGHSLRVENWPDVTNPPRGVANPVQDDWMFTLSAPAAVVLRGRWSRRGGRL